MRHRLLPSRSITKRKMSFSTFCISVSVAFEQRTFQYAAYANKNITDFGVLLQDKDNMKFGKLIYLQVMKLITACINIFRKHLKVTRKFKIFISWCGRKAFQSY